MALPARPRRARRARSVQRDAAARARAVARGRRGARRSARGCSTASSNGASTTSSQIIRVDADPEEPERVRKPAVGADRRRRADPAPPDRRAARRTTARGPRAATRCSSGRRKLRARLAKLAPQIGFLDAIRAELPEDGIFVDEVTQMGFAARLALPGLQAAHLHLARLPGRARLGLCDRARRAGRAPRRAGGRDHRRRRLHVHRDRDGDRDPPPHPAHGRGVRRRRLRQCAAHPGGALRQPDDRERPHQPGFRALRRKLRRRRRARPHAGGAARRAQARAQAPRRPEPDRGAGRPRCPRPGSSSCCRGCAAEGAARCPWQSPGLLPRQPRRAMVPSTYDSEAAARVS